MRRKKHSLKRDFKVLTTIMLLTMTNIVSSSVFFNKAHARPSPHPEEGTTAPRALEDIFNENYRDDFSRMTHENVISFINTRLSDTRRAELEVEVNVRNELLQSEDHYLCVNEYLSGFPNEIDEDRVELDFTVSPITVLSEEPVIEVDAAGNEIIYWRIEYEGESYWGRHGINYNDGRQARFINQYKDCPKIQDAIFDVHLQQRIEEIEAQANSSQGGFSLPPSSSGFLKYVCTESAPLNAYNTKEEVESGEYSVQLPRGTQVVQVQGDEKDPFTASNEHTYIYVQIQRDFENENDELARERFWVAEDYIKQFEDCAAIQTKPVLVCSEARVPLYSDDINLGTQSHDHDTEGFSHLYRRYGEYFEKKIILNANNQEEIYVPVSETRMSENIYWIKESLIPEDCPLNPEVEVNFRSSEGQTCSVFANDNFPLDHAAREDYRHDYIAKFGARRAGGRSHPAVDLYSYYRYGNGSTEDYGGPVRAINRGVVKRIGTWRHTTYLIVASGVSERSWVYAEIGRRQVNENQAINRNQLLGNTAQFVTNNSAYPAMLHLELFNDKHLEGNTHYGASGRYEGARVDDPTCNAEYMSVRKFQKTWEGE